MSMRGIAQFLESLTFTYGVDAFTIHKRLPINPIDFDNEGHFAFGYGGKIQGPMDDRFFHDYLTVSENTNHWRFRVRKDRLHVEYLTQSRLEDGEYYIETADSSNRVLDVLSGNNVGTNDYKPNATSQKVTLKFDEKYYATTIKFNGTNKYLRWDKSNGNNVIASDKMASGDIGEQYWYLVDKGNGTYNIVAARQHSRFLNLDSNNTNISVTTDRKNTKQQFKLVKANERKSIVNSNVKIVSKLKNSKVLNIHLGAGDSRNLTIWDDAGVTQQRFKFEYDANKNAYRIRDAYHNGYLAWNPGSNRNVSTHQGHYTNSGYWVLEHAGDGYYYIKNLHDQDMVLNVDGSDASNGSNVSVAPKKNIDKQKFKLVY